MAKSAILMPNWHPRTAEVSDRRMINARRGSQFLFSDPLIGTHVRKGGVFSVHTTSENLKNFKFEVSSGARERAFLENPFPIFRIS